MKKNIASLSSVEFAQKSVCLRIINEGTTNRGEPNEQYKSRQFLLAYNHKGTFFMIHI